jgi:hypothetical protein
VGLNFPTVLAWFSQLEEVRTALYSACWHRPTREPMEYEPELQHYPTAEGTIEARMAIMLRASALSSREALFRLSLHNRPQLKGSLREIMSNRCI